MTRGDEYDQRMTLAEAREIAMALPIRTRLAVAAWTFDALRASWAQGGTYRYLVYEALGFGPASYALLMDAGALELHNALGELDERGSSS